MVHNKILNPSFFKEGLLLLTLVKEGETLYFLKDTSFPPTMYEIEEECARHILLFNQYGLNLPDFVDDMEMTLWSLEEERLLAKHSEPFVSSSSCWKIIIRDCDPLVTKIYRFTKPVFTKEGLFLTILFVFSSLWFLTRDFSWFRFYNLTTFQLLILVFFGISILIIGTIHP